MYSENISGSAKSSLPKLSGNGEWKVSGKSVLTATTVPVKVGVRRGNVVEIKKGINAGDLVVISGQIKLYNGSHVKINNLK